jgi:hypothetical protein
VVVRWRGAHPMGASARSLTSPPHRGSAPRVAPPGCWCGVGEERSLNGR